MNDHLKHSEEFYDLLEHLEQIVGGKRTLNECDGRMSWPQRGVYFFFESGEYRQREPNKMRVVRVGTHAVSRGSKSSLWGRLRTHRGTKHGGGNHRGSIFRLHIGTALIARAQGMIEVPSWGQGKYASKEIKLQEKEHELRVSEYIGKMPFLWVDIDDEPGVSSDRALIEKNAIALLAGTHGDSPSNPASKEWLGHFNPNRKIQASGLWNLNYVGEANKPYLYDSIFLRALRVYISNSKN